MTFLADGQRRSLAVPKPDAGAVLLFGGSYTQAYGVRDEDTFFYRLNREFDDREFASYGTGGYGTVQSMLLAERVLDETPPERQPELLMYGFVKGHPKRNVAKPGWILELTDASGRIVVPPYVRLRDGRLERHPHEVIERWSLANRAELAALGQRLWIHATYGVTRSRSSASAATDTPTSRCTSSGGGASATGCGPATAASTAQGFSGPSCAASVPGSPGASRRGFDPFERHPKRRRSGSDMANMEIPRRRLRPPAAARGGGSIAGNRQGARIPGTR
jgi:hypothetical protein